MKDKPTFEPFISCLSYRSTQVFMNILPRRVTQFEIKLKPENPIVYGFLQILKFLLLFSPN